MVTGEASAGGMTGPGCRETSGFECQVTSIPSGAAICREARQTSGHQAAAESQDRTSELHLPWHSLLEPEQDSSSPPQKS